MGQGATLSWESRNHRQMMRVDFFIFFCTLYSKFPMTSTNAMIFYLQENK